MPALNKSYTLYYVVTLKDPIERGLKAKKMLLLPKKVINVTLKDPIERGLKDSPIATYRQKVICVHQRPDRKGLKVSSG